MSNQDDNSNTYVYTKKEFKLPQIDTERFNNRNKSTTIKQLIFSHCMKDSVHDSKINQIKYLFEKFKVTKQLIMHSTN